MKLNVLSLAVIFICGLLSAGELRAAVKTGTPAPEFSLLGNDGKAYKLSDFKGKYVVLEWFNDECPYVKKHYSSKNMQNLQKEFADKGVVWFTIASSAPGKQGHVS